MQIKSKYKIARRLGPAVFEKTQTQKYAARNGGRRSEGRAATDYGKAMLEKQKARFTYLINESQFKNYAKASIAERKKKPDDSLFERLEMRLDNTVYRLGLGLTRLASKQIVNHGHISVNGKRVNVPSYKVSVGDTIAIMARSQKSPLFASIEERAKEIKIPSWLSLDAAKKEGKVNALPKLAPSELHFDISTILDFYKR